jgi:hypothetical protein
VTFLSGFASSHRIGASIGKCCSDLLDTDPLLLLLRFSAHTELPVDENAHPMLYWSWKFISFMADLVW